MDTKEITPLQYAKIIGFTPQYIHKLLKDGRMDMLPHIIEVKRYSRFYLLVVPANLTANSF